MTNPTRRRLGRIAFTRRFVSDRAKVACKFPTEMHLRVHRRDVSRRVDGKGESKSGQVRISSISVTQGATRGPTLADSQGRNPSTGCGKPSILWSRIEARVEISSEDLEADVSDVETFVLAVYLRAYDILCSPYNRTRYSYRYCNRISATTL